MPDGVSPQGSLSRQKERNLLRGLLAICAFLGFYSGLVGENHRTGLIDIVSSLILAVTAATYTAMVCRRCSSPLPRNSLWLLVVFWPVAVPACLMWAHGRRGWWKVPVGTLVVLGVGFVGVAVGALLATHRQ
jgi:hypothetical protein